MRYLILTLALFSFVACHKKTPHDTPDQSSSATVSVRVAPVKLKEMTVFEPVVGTVRPKLEATLSSDILGRILEFPVVSGQIVKKGDLIARIDAKELAASKDRAEAALKQLQSELARQKKLLESNATSRSRYEQVLASEQMAEANLQKITATLNKARILAPFSGIIIRKFADTGDLASPGKPLVKIEDPRQLRLEMPVAESLAGSLALGAPISVEIEASNLCVQGTVSELEPSADSRSRTFLVKVDLPHIKDIRAGLFAKASVPRGQRQKLLIPTSSVIQRGQMELAFVVSDGRARLRLIRTVPQSEEYCEVLSGLSEGEKVIVDPPNSLRDGDSLNIQQLP